MHLNILIISKNHRSHINANTDSQTHRHTITQLFSVQPVACLSSGLLWVLAGVPACLRPLPQSAALPFNKIHLNLNTQAESNFSFNLPLKASNLDSVQLCVWYVNSNSPSKFKIIILSSNINTSLLGTPVLYFNTVLQNTLTVIYVMSTHCYTAVKSITRINKNASNLNHSIQLILYYSKKEIFCCCCFVLFSRVWCINPTKLKGQKREEI